MFKIKTSKVEEVLEYVTYVKLQSNGALIICDSKDEAHGVLNKDQSLIYAFKDSPISSMYEIAEVSIIALDDYLGVYLNTMRITELPEKLQTLEHDNETLAELNQRQQSDIDFLMLMTVPTL